MSQTPTTADWLRQRYGQSQQQGQRQEQTHLEPAAGQPSSTADFLRQRFAVPQESQVESPAAPTATPASGGGSTADYLRSRYAKAESARDPAENQARLAPATRPSILQPIAALQHDAQMIAGTVRGTAERIGSAIGAVGDFLTPDAAQQAVRQAIPTQGQPVPPVAPDPEPAGPAQATSPQPTPTPVDPAEARRQAVQQAWPTQGQPRPSRFEETARAMGIALDGGPAAPAPPAPTVPTQAAPAPTQPTAPAAPSQAPPMGAFDRAAMELGIDLRPERPMQRPGFLGAVGQGVREAIADPIKTARTNLETMADAQLGNLPEPAPTPEQRAEAEARRKVFQERFDTDAVQMVRENPDLLNAPEGTNWAERLALWRVQRDPMFMHRLPEERAQLLDRAREYYGGATREQQDTQVRQQIRESDGEGIGGFRTAFNAFSQGALRSTAGPLAMGWDLIAHSLRAGGIDVPLKREQVDQAISDIPLDPEYEKGVAGLVARGLPEGAASMAAFLLAGTLGQTSRLARIFGSQERAAGVTASLAGAAMGADQGYVQTLQMEDPNALQATLLIAGNGLLGTSEGLPVANFFRIANKRTGGKFGRTFTQRVKDRGLHVGREGVVQALEEAGQEYGQGFYGSLIEELANAEMVGGDGGDFWRGVMRGAEEGTYGATVGGILGGLMGGGAVAAQRRGEGAVEIDNVIRELPEADRDRVARAVERAHRGEPLTDRQQRDWADFSRRLRQYRQRQRDADPDVQQRQFLEQRARDTAQTAHETPATPESAADPLTQRLLDAGFTEQQIARMDPDQVQDALGRSPRQEATPDEAPAQAQPQQAAPEVAEAPQAVDAQAVAAGEEAVGGEAGAPQAGEAGGEAIPAGVDEVQQRRDAGFAESQPVEDRLRAIHDRVAVRRGEQPTQDDLAAAADAERWVHDAWGDNRISSDRRDELNSFVRTIRGFAEQRGVAQAPPAEAQAPPVSATPDPTDTPTPPSTPPAPDSAMEASIRPESTVGGSQAQQPDTISPQEPFNVAAAEQAQPIEQRPVAEGEAAQAPGGPSAARPAVGQAEARSEQQREVDDGALREVVPNATVESFSDPELGEGWTVRQPDGSSYAVRWTDDVEGMVRGNERGYVASVAKDYGGESFQARDDGRTLTVPETFAAYRAMPEPDRVELHRQYPVVGGYRDGEVLLLRTVDDAGDPVTADMEALREEAFHAAMDQALTDEQRNTVLDAYHRQGEGREAAEERAFSARLRLPENAHNDTPAQQILRSIATGDIWRQRARERGQRQQRATEGRDRDRKRASIPQPFTRAGIEQRLLQADEGVYDATETLRAELEANHPEIADDSPFQFAGAIPTEVTERLEGRADLRMRFRGNQPHGRGEDLLAALGDDRFFELVEAEVGGAARTQQVAQAIRQRRNAVEHDPEGAFLAYLHERMSDPGVELADQTAMPASDLQAGDEFTIHGEPFVVEGGELVGEDLRVPLDALESVPVDEGSLVEGEVPFATRRRTPGQMGMFGEASDFNPATGRQTGSLFEQQQQAVTSDGPMPANAEKFSLSQADVRAASAFSEGEPTAAFAYGVKRHRDGHSGIARVEGITRQEANEAMRGLRAAQQGASRATRDDVQQRQQRTAPDEGTGMLFSVRRNPRESLTRRDNGEVNFGQINPTVAKAIGRTPGPIRLRMGEHMADGRGYGAVHLATRHGKELVDAGFARVEDFVQDVASNYTHIYEADGTDRLILVKRNGNALVSVVELRRDEHKPIWSVVTGYVQRRDKKMRGRLLWERSEPASSSPGSAGPASSSTPGKPQAGADIRSGVQSDGPTDTSIDPGRSQVKRKGETRFSVRRADGSEAHIEPAADAGTRQHRAKARQEWLERGTESRFFKRWFKDSKVVDGEGKPLVVYHGTITPGFTEFDASRHGTATDHGSWGVGFYFSKNAEKAGEYTRGSAFRAGMGRPDPGAMYPVYLKIENPITPERLREVYADLLQNRDLAEGQTWEGLLRDELIERGHDGVFSPDWDRVMVLNPEQIKSATGNAGTFDEGSPDIRFAVRRRGAAMGSLFDAEGAVTGPQQSLFGQKPVEADPAADAAEVHSETDAEAVTGDLFSNTLPPAEVDESAGAATTVDTTKPRRTPAETRGIQDAGEKIGGARKDQWAARAMVEGDLADLSDREAYEYTTKDHVWAKPNYEAEVNAGADPVTMYLVKQIRDKLPVRPKDSEIARKHFIEAVGVVRDVLAEARTPADVRNAINTVHERLGWSQEGGRGWRPSGPTAREKLFSLYKGRSSPLRISAWDQAKAERHIKQTGWPAKQPAHRKGFQIHEGTDGEFFITRTNSRMIVADGLDSHDAADAWLKQHNTRKQRRGVVRPQLRNIEREGHDFREGRDINEQQMLDTFGFRGIEFGNWTNQQDRQQSINHAYDALMDLANVLDLPASAISLDGRLGLAFGARGSGGRNAGSAHYEPVKQAINLTKMSGAGSLAHEWAHAVDDYLGTLSGDAGKEFYASKGTTARSQLRPELKAAIEQVMQTLRTRNKTQAERIKNAGKQLEQSDKYIRSWFRTLREDMASAERGGPRARAATAEEMQAWDSLVDAMAAGHGGRHEFEQALALYRDVNGRLPSKETRSAIENNLMHKQIRLKQMADAQAGEGQARTKSDFQVEAGKLDEGRSKPYWSTPHEMFARAMEAYVYDQITQNGRSDFLVHSVDEFSYPGAPGKPYPTGDERTAINQAFDNLFQTIRHETSTDDAGRERTRLFAVRRRRDATPSARAARAAAEAAATPTKPAKAVKTQIREATGQRDTTPPIVMSEMKALKTRIRAMARQSRTDAAAQRKVGMEAAKLIRDLQLRGHLNPTQTKALANRAVKVNFANPKNLELFFAYAEKVAAKANYAHDLAQARRQQKQAKQVAKRKTIPANYAETLKAIGKVNTGMLDDPRQFAERIKEFMRSFLPPSNPRFQLADTKQMMDYLAAQQKQADEATAALQANVTEQVDTAGVTDKEIADALAADDLTDMLDDMSEAKASALDGALKAIAETAKGSLTDYRAPRHLTADEAGIVDTLKQVPIEKLSTDQKRQYIVTADNILINDAFYGAQRTQMMAKAVLGMPKAMEAAKDSNIRQVLGRGQLGQMFHSVSDMFRGIFGYGNAMAAVQVHMGHTDLIRAHQRFITQINGVADETNRFFKDLAKRHKRMHQPKNLLSEGLAGYLIQPVEGRDAAESLAIRRHIVEQDIAQKKRFRSTRDEAKLVEALLGELDAADAAGILANHRRLYPGNHEALLFYRDQQLPRYRDQLQQHDILFENQANNFDTPNYLPINYRRLPREQVIEEDDLAAPALTEHPRKTKQAANTIKRQAYLNLPNGFMLNLNLRLNVWHSLSESLNKANTNPATEQIRQFLKLPEAEQLFGSPENLSYVTRRMNLLIEARSRSIVRPTEADEWLDAASNIARRYSASAALGGIYQAIKQAPDQLTTTLFNTNFRADLLGVSMVDYVQSLKTQQGAAAMLNKFAIGSRGDIQGGTKFVNSIDVASDRVARALRAGNLPAVRATVNRAMDIWTVILRESDALAAKSGWLTYYRQNLAEQGIAFEGWEAEARLVESDPKRQQAATYAETMIDITQVSSDVSKMSQLAQRGRGGYENLAKAVLMPYASFTVQGRSRIVADVRDLASWRNPDKAARSLAGTLAGYAAFSAIKIYALAAVTQWAAGLVLQAFDIEPEDKTEEQLKEEAAFKLKRWYSEFARDAIAGGFPTMVGDKFIDGLNFGAYYIGATFDMDFVKGKRGEMVKYSTFSRGQQRPFYRWKQWDAEHSLGMFDVIMERPGKVLGEVADAVDVSGREDLTERQKALAYFSMMSELLYSARLNDADIYRMIARAKRDYKKQIAKPPARGRGGRPSRPARPERPERPTR